MGKSILIQIASRDVSPYALCTKRSRIRGMFLCIQLQTIHAVLS